MQHEPTDRVVFVREFRERTGLARSTVYAMIEQGLLDAPRRISPGRVGWLNSYVTAWIEARMGAKVTA